MTDLNAFDGIAQLSEPETPKAKKPRKPYTITPHKDRRKSSDPVLDRIFEVLDLVPYGTLEGELYDIVNTVGTVHGEGGKYGNAIVYEHRTMIKKHAVPIPGTKMLLSADPYREGFLVIKLSEWGYSDEDLRDAYMEIEPGFFVDTLRSPNRPNPLSEERVAQLVEQLVTGINKLILHSFE